MAGRTADLDTVQNANIISIILQLITGIIGVFALAVPIKDETILLSDLLGLEMGVQLVELVFYVLFLFLSSVMYITNLRYVDWFLSTPVMLFTMSAYFNYEKDNGNVEKARAWTFFEKNRTLILLIFFFNALMLVSGLLGELGLVSRLFAFFYGFLALLCSFGIMYRNFLQTTEFSQKMFAGIFGIWSAYGVAFMMSDVAKNVIYSVLDILAKNFFGLYLSYKILNQV